MRVPYRVEKLRGLLRVSVAISRRSTFGKPLSKGVTRVAGDELLLDGAGKRATQDAMNVPAGPRRRGRLPCRRAGRRRPKPL